MTAPVVVDPIGRRAEVSFTREYYEMGQMSKFVRPGAVRISSNEPSDLHNVAFENADGTRVLVLHNARDEEAAISVNLDEGSHFRTTVPAGGIATYRWVSW